jgi:hypothetical protein
MMNLADIAIFSCLGDDIVGSHLGLVRSLANNRGHAGPYMTVRKAANSEITKRPRAGS